MSNRRPPSVAEIAADEVRNMIDSGVIRPGERINTDEVAQRLGISSTPVRDALRMLVSEGIVEVIARVGAFVRYISDEEAQDVYLVKGLLEPLAAARSAERGTCLEKKQLSEMVEELKVIAGTDDIRSCAKMVGSIHHQIFITARSDFLLDMYNVINGRVKILRYLNMAQPGRLEISVRQHSEIVDAIVTGDVVGAEGKMRSHMAGAAESVKAVISEVYCKSDD